MDSTTKKTLKHKLSKPGKTRRLKRTEVLQKRQSMRMPDFLLGKMHVTHAILADKIWLETHLWHAKRMKMETMWGFRLVCERSEALFGVLSSS
jgi:ribonuclease P/MRP protein subunit POP1